MDQPVTEGDMKYYRNGYENIFAGSGEREANEHYFSANTEGFYFEMFLIYETSNQEELKELKVRQWSNNSQNCSEISYKVDEDKFYGDLKNRSFYYDFIDEQKNGIDPDIINPVLDILREQ